MARMIPRWIDDEAPASERRVFEKLERDPAAGNWTVLHSLGLARSKPACRPSGWTAPPWSATTTTWRKSGTSARPST